MLRIIIASLVAIGLSDTASAHPHVFVDARAEVIFDSSGRLTAVKNQWRFDEAFSAYAKQGLAHLANGRLTEASLEALARVNIHALAPYKFFTFQRVDGKHAPLGDGADQKLSDDGEHLTLSFTVRPGVPVDTGRTPVTIELYDPEYFVAMSFVKTTPVKLTSAPANCKLQVFTPTGLSAAAAAALARVPASERVLPPELQSMTGGIENGLVIDCTATK